MPKVTVIIPVYNAGLYLQECLESVLSQTLEDIEVLCVDDGSTDDSLEILSAFARNDSRLAVLQQPNAGAGAARNLGLQAARGEYLSFLDADDFFEPTMLEEAYNKCIADAADIAIYKARYFDTGTGRFRPADGVLKINFLPDKIPFSYEDIPDHILVFVSPAPWNKLFRRAFVLERGLQFQEIKRANDLFFTRIALVSAERITIVDKVLVNYRMGVGSNLQSSNHKTPLEFYKAVLAIKTRLVELGVYHAVERSFVNDALSHCLYNLNSLQTPDSFRLLYDRLGTELFAELGIEGRPEAYFIFKRHFEQYTKIVELSSEDYLFYEARDFRNRLTLSVEQAKRMKARLAKTKKQLSKIQASNSYRLGRLITAIPRGILRLFPKSRRAA